MNTFFFVFIVFAAVVQIHSYVLSSEEKEALEHCKTKLEITEEIGEHPNLEDPKIKCLVACTWKELDLIENGKIVLEKELHFLDQKYPGTNDTVKELTTECVNEANEEADECDVAAAAVKCIKEKIYHIK